MELIILVDMTAGYIFRSRRLGPSTNINELVVNVVYVG